MESKIGISRGCNFFYENNNLNACCTKSCGSKLEIFDWLNYLPKGNQSNNSIVEVRFKNTRKGFFSNVNNLRVSKGDIVAVEASPGHDIGVVTLTGELVMIQVRKSGVDTTAEFKKIYRKAKPADLEKWLTAIQIEHQTMIKSRQIAEDLNLDMKIGDVEFQGDNTKAIFYYIAEERVDFRELIKVLAEEFKIRIEMRQIGARQEAGLIGGIGSCGRELCCSTWITNFVSVTTNSARYQELSLNPQKLAGQCSKLKCCLNYELDAYMDARKDFPEVEAPLETKEGTAYHQKTDIFKRVMWYSFNREMPTNLIPVPVTRVIEILTMNRDGKVPEKLLETDALISPLKEPDYENVVGQESLTRFDEKGKKKKKRRNKKRQKHNEKPKQ